MKKYIYKTRVRYGEVDRMGTVYYGNYFLYMESARTGLLREAGLPYSTMEDRGIMLPVTETNCKYKNFLRFDEEIVVETSLEYIRNASVKIKYRIKNAEGKMIALGYTIHPFINKDWKIVNIPEEIREKIEIYLEE